MCWDMKSATTEGTAGGASHHARLGCVGRNSADGAAGWDAPGPALTVGRVANADHAVTSTKCSAGASRCAHCLGARTKSTTEGAVGGGEGAKSTGCIDFVFSFNIQCFFSTKPTDNQLAVSSLGFVNVSFTNSTANQLRVSHDSSRTTFSKINITPPFSHL